MLVFQIATGIVLGFFCLLVLFYFAEKVYTILENVLAFFRVWLMVSLVWIFIIFVCYVILMATTGGQFFYWLSLLFPGGPIFPGDSFQSGLKRCLWFAGLIFSGIWIYSHFFRRNLPRITRL